LTKGVIATAACALLVASVAFGTMAGAQEKKAPKAKSKCNAITEETACKADATCIWIPATVIKKTGKERKAYCKTKSVPAKKAKAEPKEPKKK
jgi:hypothetical protein